MTTAVDAFLAALATTEGAVSLDIDGTPTIIGAGNCWGASALPEPASGSDITLPAILNFITDLDELDEEYQRNTVDSAWYHVRIYLLFAPLDKYRLQQALMQAKNYFHPVRAALKGNVQFSGTCSETELKGARILPYFYFGRTYWAVKFGLDVWLDIDLNS